MAENTQPTTIKQVKNPEQKLNIEGSLTLGDLRWLIKQKYDSYNRCARAMGISRSYLSMMLAGKEIPKKQTIIERYASYFGISSLKLSRLFDELRGKK